MKAEDWKRLGQSVAANAELLELLANSDELGVTTQEKGQKKLLSWLIAKNLIDVDDGVYSLSSLMLDLGAQISMTGFERAALDLEESIIAITNLCESYGSARDSGSVDRMARIEKKLSLRLRQIIKAIRSEIVSTRMFVEAGFNFSNTLSDQLREIRHVADRLVHIHDRLSLFTYESLSPLCHDDRTLHRVIVKFFLSALSKQRVQLHDLITRLNKLSVAVRKRKRQRQLILVVDAWLDSGNILDLLPMQDAKTYSGCIRAQGMSLSGHAVAGHTDADYVAQLESIIASLPPPKEPSLRDAVQRSEGEYSLVPDVELEQEEEVPPFAEPHLIAMLEAYKQARAPQSAVDYWLLNGHPEDDLKVWLCALDNYLLVLQSEVKNTGGKLNFSIIPEELPMSRYSANQYITDIWICSEHSLYQPRVRAMHC